jgi:hypothetical protein
VESLHHSIKQDVQSAIALPIKICQRRAAANRAAGRSTVENSAVAVMLTGLIGAADGVELSWHSFIRSVIHPFVRNWENKTRSMGFRPTTRLLIAVARTDACADVLQWTPKWV